MPPACLNQPLNVSLFHLNTILYSCFLHWTCTHIVGDGLVPLGISVGVLLDDEAPRADLLGVTGDNALPVGSVLEPREGVRGAVHPLCGTLQLLVAIDAIIEGIAKLLRLVHGDIGKHL